MSLERFRKTRMIVLRSRATAYQAARAMADNRIGSIRVSDAGSITGMVTDRDLALVALGGGLDPNATTLGAVMSEDVVTCEIDTELDEAVRMMRDAGIRRIPITEGGRLSGLIAFDDLVVDGSVDLEALRSVVTAQLEVEAPQKPAGALYPQAPARAEHRAAGRAHALAGAQARAEATYNRLVTAIDSAAALDRDRAERAFLIAEILAAGHEARRLPIDLCHISDGIHPGTRPSLTGKYLPSRSSAML